jgi:hypothetical protein
MPQLSVYIDKETLSKVEAQSRLDDVSVSKLVVSALNEYLSNNWPKNYVNLFGAIKDETFKAPDDLPPSSDDMGDLF